MPGPSPFTAPAWRPDRRSRSGRGRRPPRRRSRRSERGSLPAPGADGTTVRASQPLNLARREAGEDGAARPRSGGPADPHAGRGGRIGYSAARVARGPCPARPGQHPAGGARGGSPSPWNWRGCRGELAHPPGAGAGPGPCGRAGSCASSPRAGAPWPTTSTNAANCGDPNRGGRHYRVAGPQPDGRDHHLLEHVEARRRRLREEAGRARCGRRQRSWP